MSFSSFWELLVRVFFFSSMRLQALMAKENMVEDITRQNDRIYSLAFSTSPGSTGREKMELLSWSLVLVIMLEIISSEEAARKKMPEKYPIPIRPKTTVERM